jgi:hypothetical protein
LYTGIKQQSFARVLVGDIPIDFRLPFRQETLEEEWSVWGDLPSESSDDDNSSDSASSLGRRDAHQGKSKIAASLKPWKTLLPVRPRVLRAGFKRQLAKRRNRNALGPVDVDMTDVTAIEPESNSEAVEALLAALDPSST